MYRILQTLTQLAEAFTNRQQCDEAVRLYEFVLEGYKLLFGSDKTVFSSFILQQKAEALAKKATDRKPEPLEQA